MSDISRRTALAGISAAALGSTVAASSAGASPKPDSAFAPRPGMPKEVRMTWFGISNFHYQIGELGILLDGAVTPVVVAGETIAS